MTLLKVRDRFGAGKGYTLPAYLILYGAWRFFIEFFRDDNPTVFTYFSEQQVFCVFFILAGAVIWAVLHRFSPKKAPAAPAVAR